MTDTLVALRHKLAEARQLASVVRAMKAVAAASITEYEAAVAALAHYQRAVEVSLGACLRRDGPGPPSSPAAARDAPLGALVFGSDQGLVGRFNENIGDLALRTLRDLPGPKWLWTVGERITSYLELGGLTVRRQFSTPGSVAAIAGFVTEVQLEIEGLVAAGHCSEVLVFCNHPEEGARYVGDKRRLLPLDREWRSRLAACAWPTPRAAEVLGDTSATLAGLVREQLFISLYRACAESLASENGSRLEAMQRAERNIESVSTDLQRSSNRLRQTSIDTELFDVLAGFNSLTHPP
ncbi:MAG TPA: F0F1 ATP synthase subunit gamma [Steroidobacteraceae bacterium]|nr:F0F1 ATP synthase subunit gamma [Steroidobacteraceae bacterium]